MAEGTLRQQGVRPGLAVVREMTSASSSAPLTIPVPDPGNELATTAHGQRGPGRMRRRALLFFFYTAERDRSHGMHR
jgi:hypothetical protein